MNPSPTPRTPKSTAMSVNMLLSPPEMIKVDSFQEPVRKSSSKNPFASRTSTTTYVSPPISPYEVSKKDITVELQRDSQSQRDPLLFDNDVYVDNSASRLPLFDSSDSESARVESQISQHIANTTHVPESARPTRDEYKVLAEATAMFFKQVVTRNFLADQQGWRAQEREINKRYTYHSLTKRPALKTLLPATSSAPKSKKIAVAMPRRARVTKPATKPQPVLKERKAPAGVTKPTPAPRKTTTKINDNRFDAFPDFAPRPDRRFYDDPLIMTKTADARDKFKAPINQPDLDDPDRHLLPPAEQHLAAYHRLTCAQYLTQKRRIFIAKVEWLKKGQDFKKTHAQGACKIDVNKASRLWDDFDKAGWFAKENFTQYLR
ncbi:hypothetical protein EJ05DRAFT_502978 [Pseudovirgaria hyperparasitica]|uniref:SWIRM domain-containing protein n=1 Tax=Pseudovirgaria hyperparasitica TaxID=470096 RepID=A0A6A6W3A6_9PEZI|nr:uncharacterized protein EJ05DRAFT_502978 [Pseudovirgaria hyperparasitica]KAF2755521.1 hypothetical protein EJ05DRAFT_502978 [Pseudovirgaria hyperparasitica]